MTKYTEWCDEIETSVSSHRLHQLTAKPAKLTHATAVIARELPGYYAAPSRIADLLNKLGKPAAAKYVAEKLPTTKSIRSGDLAEILCNAYVLEATAFTQGIKRLRWKDHRNMSMRGEDVLAFSFDAKGKLYVLKAEVKSRVAMSTTVISEARKSLSANNELPSPHAISFVADRLNEIGDLALKDALDSVQLKAGFDTSQVTHMLFTFSENDPSKLLEASLAAYSGTSSQHFVSLRVQTHQTFIKDVFESVGK